jgi:cell pole-organizing protein PopZ
MTSNKLSPNSKIGDILNTVNAAVEQKKSTNSISAATSAATSQATDDLLELTEAVPMSPDASSVKISDKPADKPADKILDKAQNQTINVEKGAPAVDSPTVAISAQSKDESSKNAPSDSKKISDDVKHVVKQLDSNNMSKLVSDTTAEAATTMLKQLKDQSDAKCSSDGLKFSSGTTVESLVIELMKPYISQWLDQNLPAIVKTAVEKEVRKLVPQD